MCVITVKFERTWISTRGAGSELLVYHSKDMKISSSANEIICNSACEERGNEEVTCFRMFEQLRPGVPPRCVKKAEEHLRILELFNISAEADTLPSGRLRSSLSHK